MKFSLLMSLLLSGLVHAAGLEFDSMLQDVHAPADAATVTADFKFTNKGDKPVTIAKSDPGCSCLSVQVSGGKLKYAPGESGVVRATFEMGNFSGTVDKVIALWLDNDRPDKPSKSLVVRVHIPVLVALEPKTVRWDIGGKPDPQVIQIRMAEGETIHVTGVKSSSSSFSFDLKEVEKGRKYDLHVTPLSIETPGMAVVRIETDCKVTRHRIQQAFAVVARPAKEVPAAKP
jgi:hypothetical protein